MAPSREAIPYPSCGHFIERSNPVPTVDIIIEIDGKIILIQRRNEPRGWALPGGFVDYGESVENAAIREALEETSLSVKLTHLLGVYSDPNRDPRGHTISTVFIARGIGLPQAADDAESLDMFDAASLPQTLAFDHRKILQDYFSWKAAKSKDGIDGR